MASKRILIVGGVAGGASCAARLRRMDEQAEIYIFERGPDVSFANCGLPYYVGGVIAKRQSLLVATPERFRDLFKIEVRTRCEVQRINRERKTIDVRQVITGKSTEYPYDTLVLSPGAAPIRPSLPGIGAPGIFTLRNLEDVDKIAAWISHRDARRAVVIGGGFIGLEMVENLAHREMEVTLLERLDQVMPQVDPEIASAVHDELRQQEVTLHLSAAVTRFDLNADETINVVDEHGRTHLADVVILAMGVRPDVTLAEQAGLEIGPTGGIRVDEQMRTSDPDIFAVGDAVELRDCVTGRPTLVSLAGPANRQGRIVADVICGRDARFRGAQGTGVVGVFGLTLAMTGANERTLNQAGIPYAKAYTHSLNHADYYPGSERIALKLFYSPDDGRVLGAQAVGRAGVEKRIDVIAMAIQMGATVYDLEEAELCYAPQYGSAKDPVNIAGFVAANTLRGDVSTVYWSDWQQMRVNGDGQPLPLVIDVRPPAMVAEGAVPDTIKIPLGELRMRLDEIPRDREIWVHCGIGQSSYFASRLLKQHGFNVRNLSGGITSYKMEPKS